MARALGVGQTWAWLHHVPRDFLSLPEVPPFDPDYDASEYEPYTDADCWRSVLEVLHQADMDLDERLRRASCIMLRSVAPLVASLDKLKYLPIDAEEHPYLTPAARAAAAGAAKAGGGHPAGEGGDGAEAARLRSPASLPAPVDISCLAACLIAGCGPSVRG